MKQQLLQRIQARSAVVGIIGQGYVGLPLALVFQEAGFTVIGFDLDAAKVEAINRGESMIRHIDPSRVTAAINSGRFRASTDFDRLRECDAAIICVPTPLGEHREPDNSYIHASGREIAKRLKRGQLVVLESTTYPGTTDEELQPLLDASGLACPKDYFLAFSPEREDPGNPKFSTRNIPKVVGGVEPDSTEVACALYAAAVDKVVKVSSARVAESSKLLENIYRSINIALVNELKMTFDRMGIDVWEVIEAAKTKPFGFTAFYPGPGLGGHCIPLDPFYLAWKAAEFGTWTRFVELAGEINTAMPRYVVAKVVEGLNENGRSLKGAKVLLLGLAYKPDVDDDRESPSYKLLELLRDGGAEVAYCDPYLPKSNGHGKRPLALESVPCDAATFRKYDALLISTAHHQFRKAELYEGHPLVVDTRNVVSPLVAASGGKGPKRLVKG